MNIKNGHNTSIANFAVFNNPFLRCIEVDDSAYSNTSSHWFKDAFAVYNTNCSTVGIESNLSSSFQVYPNPFQNQIKISNAEKGEAILYDIAGKEILRQAIFDEQAELNTEILSSGFYMLHYSDGKTTANFKMSKP